MMSIFKDLNKEIEIAAANGDRERVTYLLKLRQSTVKTIIKIQESMTLLDQQQIDELLIK